MISKEFFIVKGIGISEKSEVNAFDAALIDAGLGNSNIITVSSIIPPFANEINPKKIEDGSMVFTVLGKNSGISKDQISVGLTWGWAENKEEKIGLVVTAKQNFIDNDLLEKLLKEKINEMATARRMELLSYKTQKSSLIIPENKYGCVIVVFVYVL